MDVSWAVLTSSRLVRRIWRFACGTKMGFEEFSTKFWWFEPILVNFGQFWWYRGTSKFEIWILSVTPTLRKFWENLKNDIDAKLNSKIIYREKFWIWMIFDRILTILWFFRVKDLKFWDLGFKISKLGLQKITNFVDFTNFFIDFHHFSNKNHKIFVKI